MVRRVKTPTCFREFSYEEPVYFGVVSIPDKGTEPPPPVKKETIKKENRQFVPKPAKTLLLGDELDMELDW